MVEIARSLWFGRESLATAYWGVGLIGGVLIGGLFIAAGQIPNQTATRLAAGILAPLAVAQYVFWLRSVDQCAKNATHTVWVGLAKFSVYLSLPSYLAIVFACISRAVAEFAEYSA